MSLSSANRSLQLLMRLTDPKSSTEPMIDPLPQKPEIQCGSSSRALPRHLPERHGISSRHIHNFLDTLRRDPTLRMHSIMIVRDGCVLCEAAFGAQDISMPRMTFSACKSITALAIGILMDDGLLTPEQRLTELFPQEGNRVSRQMLKDLTVSDLLSMQTSNQFNELACMTEEDWLHGFFVSPGLGASEKFHYNSVNSYVLSRIVCQVTNMSLSAFLKKRLFDPMDIHDFFWEVCPAGYEKGGWGLYLRAEDLAKLGQLIQDDGKWGGKQLISPEFLRSATTAHAEVPPSYGRYNYGWHFWVGREENTVLFNGMLGQNVICFRDSGITVVSHAGNDETFQQSSYFEIVSRFFGGHFHPTVPRDPEAVRILRKTVKELAGTAGRLPDKDSFQRFFGKRFVVKSPRAASAGLLPVTLQAVQNCYTKGLQAIAIGGTRELVEILYEERDQLHHIYAGTKAPHVQTLNFDGNMFRVAAQARFTHDEDDRPVLRLQLDFLETPCCRILKLFLTPQGMLLRQTETPCMDQILDAVLSNSYPALTSLVGTVFGTGDLEFLRWKMSFVFAPTLEFTEES